MKRRKVSKKDDEDDDNGFAAWGGYMEAKKFKLLEQYTDAVNNETDKKSNIFSGISIFVNGYTKPTAEELKQIMSMHGGIYHHYHSSSKTNFIIASNLPDTKIKQLGLNEKIVKPEWIVDSIQAGKLLDYTKYLLYSNNNRTQPKLNFVEVAKSTPIKDDESKIISNENEDDFQLSPDIFSSFEDNLTVQNNNLTTENNDVKKVTATLTANNPKFLSEFYNNSRLHHIATLGATFKQYVSTLREQSKFVFPERQKLKEYLNNLSHKDHVNDSKTVIMHIDMDCFFVSVGLRKRPDLKGIPIAVTHSKGGHEPSLRCGVDRQAELDCYKQRVQEKLKLNANELGPKNMFVRLEGIENQSMSEIASCSYEARKAGVKNGMFMGTALKLCPNLQTIPYDFDGYREVAHTLYNTISEYTLNIEAVSCDEMFVDVTDLLNETKASVYEWASYIRDLIQLRTGCPCSAGFGANRLQARLATKTAKPNGQFHLQPSAVDQYMLEIKVSDLPGVGYSTSLKLKSLAVENCADLQAFTLSQLQSEFGKKTGEALFNNSRGIDNRPLVYQHERKSVSAEVNYGIRFTNQTEADEFFQQLATEVHCRLSEAKMKGKCITLKLMVRSKDAPKESSKFMGHGICDSITKSTSLSIATNNVNTIIREVLALAQKLAVAPQELRGIGIQISRLEKIKNTSGAITKFLNPNETNLEEKKRSPVLNNQVNSARRGRGRPRGRASKTIKRKNSNNGDLTKFLRNPVPTTSITVDNSSSSDSEIILVNPPDKRSIFGDMSSKQIENILQDWVCEENSPEMCDVKILGDYFYNLALNKKIDQLFVLLKFLFREIFAKGSCDWHQTYFAVVKIAQQGMRVSYGSKIWTHTDFKCENKCHLFYG